MKPLGLVQTPQSYYNVDLFQFNLFSEGDIPNEQNFFSREVNLYNSARGAAIHTGSNTVISRQAIVDVEGFPTNTITEDFQLGAQINMAGYQNISTLEPMASGLPPTDIPSILKQRIRWERGGVQSIFNIRVVDTDFWVLLAFWLQSYVLIQFVMADISSDLRTLRWGEI
ncbi:glycosyltransferase family 2 protein [Aerococcus urinaeequi]|uniref:glycosyltransferase family 2 protein n=1 Tax=Aerococcus urinaeequi TaxID=51665 RepID=UPI003ED93C9D